MYSYHSCSLCTHANLCKSRGCTFRLFQLLCGGGGSKVGYIPRAGAFALSFSIIFVSRSRRHPCPLLSTRCESSTTQRKSPTEHHRRLNIIGNSPSAGDQVDERRWDLRDFSEYATIPILYVTDASTVYLQQESSLILSTTVLTTYGAVILSHYIGQCRYTASCANTPHSQPTRSMVESSAAHHCDTQAPPLSISWRTAVRWYSSVAASLAFVINALVLMCV